MRLSTIERAAMAEAERLGQSWVGPEHGLLAILRGDADDVAHQVLEEAGLDTGMVEERLVRMVRADPRAEPEIDPCISPNPAWYRTIGRAEGIAAGIGTGEVRPVDLLFATLWDPWHFRGEPLVRREAVIAALVHRQVELPRAPLPELSRPPQFTQRVEFPLDKLERVIPLLVERHPPGSGPTFGFNHDGAERAWVDAEDGIDLQAIVDAVLRQGDHA